MRKSMTYVASCLVSGLLVLGLTGCGAGTAGTSDAGTGTSAADSSSVQESSADGLTEVTLGMVPWPAFELFYLAEDQGIFEKNGLKVKIREFSSTTDNSMAFVGGKLDFCTYASGESISPYAENQGFQIIMPMDKSNGCEGLIATSDIKSIKDLKGKTVASQFSSVDHYLLLTLLQQNGLSADDINFVDMSIEEAGSSFVAGQCDAASIWDPYFTEAKEAGGNVLYDTSENPNLISDVLAASDDMVKNHPDVVEAMVKSIYEAEDYWKANEDTADQFMAGKMDVSEESFKSQIGGLFIPDIDESLTFFDTSGDENSWGEVQNTVEKFMKEMDVLDADIDCNTMLNSDFLKEYKASADNDAGADVSAVSASS